MSLPGIAEQMHPDHTAVVVIDVQHDFCSADGAMATVLGLDLSPIQRRVPDVNALVADARALGVPVVWVREAFLRDRMTSHQRRLYTDGDGIWLVGEGTEGAGWYAELTSPLPGEPVVTKRNYDAFSNTDLDLLLRGLGVRTVVMAGFTTNVCVETGARQAYVKGYDLVVVSDCTAAPSQAEHDASLVNIGKYFGAVLDRHAVADAWRRHRAAPAARLTEAVG
jgi:nicotinamidase-related amidase